MSKGVFLLGLFVLIGCGVFSIVESPSYKHSFQARFYYFLGEYKEANSYAKMSLDENRYNKMAFGVYTQSLIAMKYQEYIKRGEEYFAIIDRLSEQERVTKANKAKIKMICGIMLGEFKELSSTKLTDEALVKSANDTYKRFEKIKNKLF